MKPGVADSPTVEGQGLSQQLEVGGTAELFAPPPSDPVVSTGEQQIIAPPEAGVQHGGAPPAAGVQHQGAPPAAGNARNISITYKRMESHGPTLGCKGCADFPNSYFHTKACRRRFNRLCGVPGDSEDPPVVTRTVGETIGDGSSSSSGLKPAGMPAALINLSSATDEIKGPRDTKNDGVSKRDISAATASLLKLLKEPREQTKELKIAVAGLAAPTDFSFRGGADTANRYDEVYRGDAVN